MPAVTVFYYLAVGDLNILENFQAIVHDCEDFEP